MVNWHEVRAPEDRHHARTPGDAERPAVEPLTDRERALAAAWVGREVGRKVRKMRMEAVALMAVTYHDDRTQDRVDQGRALLARADAFERLLYDPRGTDILTDRRSTRLNTRGGPVPKTPAEFCAEMDHVPWHEIVADSGARAKACFCGENRYEVVWQDPVNLCATNADPIEWAREFMAHFRKDPTLVEDEGRLVGWFAAAIEEGRKS